MSAVVADCDVLNFVLVHLKLGAEVQRLVVACGRSIVTLDRVYRREAQAPLRTALDELIAAGICERVAHPSDRPLDKKQRKILQQVERLAGKRYPLTSDNDRGLLVEAEHRGAPLFTEDGPLRALAAERGHPTFDARDVVTLLFELRDIDTARRDGLMAAVAARVRSTRRSDEHRPQDHDDVMARLCASPEEWGGNADDQSESSA